MAVKLTKTKDVISRNIENYQNAQVAYSKYFEGSPCLITYYKLNTYLSTHDNDLETVHSLTGNNSPKKYNRIYDVPTYGVSTLDFQNSLTERGLESVSSGELYFLPDTIEPSVEDFFTFDIDGMEDHLFRIDDVQFDRATPNKYYRVSYSLYKENADVILGNIDEDDDLQVLFNNIGTNSATVVTKSNAIKSEKAKTLFNAVLKKYVQSFYDQEMDLFTCRTLRNEQPISLWSPYVQQFIYEHKLVSGYDQNIMTEFYLQGISSIEFPSIFFDYAYDNCIFKKIEFKDDLTVDNNLIEISDLDLKTFKALPFAFTPINYSVLQFDNMHPAFFINSISVLKGESCPKFCDLMTSKKLLSETEKGFSIEKMEKSNFAYNGDILDIQTSEDPIWKIIVSFINRTFSLDDETYEAINSYHFKRNIENYISITGLLYILKNTITELED